MNRPTSEDEMQETIDWVALRRLQLDELNLGGECRDGGLVLELLRRGRLALCE